MEIVNKIGQYKKADREWNNRTYPVKKITVHHTASRYTGTDHQILTSLMNDHIGQDWPGLAYHFMILKNGVIYQINPIDKVTWHDTVNWDSIGVCLHGYFHEPHNEKPTQEQLNSLKELLDDLCTNHPEFPADHDDVIPHKARYNTACCGDLFVPKVVEYNNKLGDVDWSGPSDPADPELALDKDIPTFVEDKYKLKEKSWYNKYWTLGQLIEEFIKFRDSYVEPDPQNPAIKVSDDIPGVIEDKYKLKEKSWYNKTWTLGKFIESCIKIIEQPQPQPDPVDPIDLTGYLKLTERIPAEIEAKYGLTDKAWYSSSWTLEEFIEGCVAVQQDEMAYRTFLQYINAKLLEKGPVMPKSLKQEQEDMQFNVDSAMKKIADGVTKDITVFSYDEVKKRFIELLINKILRR